MSARGLAYNYIHFFATEANFLIIKSTQYHIGFRAKKLKLRYNNLRCVKKIEAMLMSFCNRACDDSNAGFTDTV